MKKEHPHFKPQSELWGTNLPPHLGIEKQLIEIERDETLTETDDELDIFYGPDAYLGDQYVMEADRIFKKENSTDRETLKDLAFLEEDEDPQNYP